ncbi:MAG: TrkH family potassium uptake protein [Oscillospiraceae bacterium]|nr:TrkH family potassium uptake protein [Oscillospiraceae bacterium]
MNRKIIGKTLGFLLLLECLFLFPSAFITILDGQRDLLGAFVGTMAAALVLGGGLCFLCRKAEGRYYAREGFLIVGLGWLVLSAVGALPFWLSGEIPHYVDALFEVISGFTTTGASILTNVENMSRGLLFWRSFTHWLGGMGILVFLLAVVPMGKGGYSVHLLRAESPGPSVDKLVPKTRQSATILYSIYIALTVLCVIFLLMGGMSLFDSLCTAFGTAGTGGFGVKNDSMAGYSPYLQTVCTVFMALFGVNFSLYFLVIMGRVKDALKSEELRLYVGVIVGSIAIISWNILSLYNGNIRGAVHDAAFTVSSIITTTGFATADFDLWPQLSRTILVMLMVIGACAGSTGGGIKCSRVLILFKALGARMRQMLHPRSVNLVRLEGRRVEDETLQGVYTYMTAYCAIAALSFLLLSLDNCSLETNLTAVMACLNNIGPGLDLVGPTGNYAHFSDLSKIVLMLNMLLGRLEIFPLLIMLSPRTWKRAG